MNMFRRFSRIVGLLTVLVVVTLVIGPVQVSAQGELPEGIPLPHNMEDVPNAQSSEQSMESSAPVADAIESSGGQAVVIGEDGTGMHRYVELKSLFIIYPNTAAGWLGAGDVERVKQYAIRQDEFFWRSSGMRLHVKTSFLVSNVFKDASELGYPGDKCGWLWPGDTDNDGQSVELDLWNAGVRDGQYDVINVYWAHNNGTISPCSGGYYLGMDSFSRYPDTPLATGILDFQSGAAFIGLPHPHEFIHGLDDMFDKLGYQGFFNPDYFVLTPARGGESHDFWAAFMRGWPAADWYALVPRWGVEKQLVDTDGDGIPDDADVPIDEASMGSSPTAIDSDQDGLADLGEAMAGLYRASNPNSPDTDSDGVNDSLDLTPLYPIQPYLWRKSHPLNGDPSGWDLLTESLDTTGAPFSAKLYGNWDADYIYFMFITDRYAQAHMWLDADGSGMSVGRGNFEISIDPQDPRVVTSLWFPDCSKKAIFWRKAAMDDRFQCIWSDEVFSTDPNRWPTPQSLDYLTRERIRALARPYDNGYLVQLAFPRLESSELVPFYGKQIGFEIDYRNIDHDWTASALTFELYDNVYPVLLDTVEPNEPNNNAANATAIAYGGRSGGVIGRPGDVDWYKFTGKAGDRIWVDIDAAIHDSRLESSLQLRSANQTVIGAPDLDPVTGDYTLEYALPADGWYYLRLREANHPVEGGLPYYYVLSLDVDDYAEPNDIREQATPIRLGTLLTSLTISQPGDVDYYRLDVVGNPLVDIVVNSDPATSPLDAYLCLEEPDGTVTCTDDKGADPDPMISRSLMAGTYYLHVTDIGERGGGSAYSYSLAIAPAASADPCEPNNTLTSATPIQFGSRVDNLTLDPVGAPTNGDVDFFKFDGRIGETIYADVRARRDGSPLDATLQLQGPNGNTVLASNNNFGGSPDPYLEFRLPADGTYYLRVRSARHPNDGGPDYTYSLQVMRDLYEPNDTMVQATTIAYGQTLSAEVHPVFRPQQADWDVDYYRFSGKVGDHVAARLLDTFDGELKLLGPNGAPLLDTSDCFGNCSDQLVQATLPVTGDYYLRVEPWFGEGGPATGPYSLELDMMRFVSAATGGTVAGLDFDRSDILAYYQKGARWELLLDASDVGITQNLSAFSILPGDAGILMSFQYRQVLTDLRDMNGNSLGRVAVMPQDVVLFNPRSLGDNTSGSFSWLFDGSDAGLADSGEAIDALALAPDGRLLVSTTGAASVPGTVAADEDLLAFSPSAWGSAIAGTWSLYFDGSTVAGLAVEDIVGAAVDSRGYLYVTLSDSFTVGGVSGGPATVIGIRPNKSVFLEWDSTKAKSNYRLDGLDLPDHTQLLLLQ